MKRFLFLFLCFIAMTSYAQDTYTIGGETYQLNMAIDGDIDLLWNTIEGKYRYFIRKNDGTIVELKNTRKDGKFQEEYREVIKEIDTENVVDENKVDLTLYSLRKFVDKHNMSVDPNYVTQLENIKIQFRFEGFGGITNVPLINNPENVFLPQIGFSFEMIDFETFKRHALYLNGRQVFKRDKFDYSLSELALGYRYRLIDRRRFNFYGNITFGVLSYLNTIIAFSTEEGELITENYRGTEFDAPITIGIGMDYNLTADSFITLGIHELYSIVQDNRGNFPINLTMGYKVNL